MTFDDVQIIDQSTTERLLRDGAVLIDNRPEHKFQSGHLKGAINLPYFKKDHPSNIMTKENLLEAMGDQTVVVFYCSGALRAYHALKQAKAWGIDAQMYWYKDGFDVWKITEWIE
ncbi:Rhodanese domain protein [Desulfamplus magnetovallimortis]|uniref:Rhodanese domain protein n=1 Tax=Desulfamplus magnetovallimortis TaxID=1246637 RepID=A0A1W1HIH4_9BACT|nr:rhodanese-like domain-containing protein [Desulfamplus magnetovallimortis]SLM32264.1 Rhodanese domain protein [Desulfamplus magnetovallimortis]